MPRPIRARPTASRCAAVTLVVLAIALAACATPRSADPLPFGEPLASGQPPGTVVVTGGTDVATVVRDLQAAVVAGGGPVLTVVDHRERARTAGVEIPADTVVIGGPTAAGLELLQSEQRAGATLPERYLVEQRPGGPVTVTYNSAAYIAAVGAVITPGAQTALRASAAAVVSTAVGADPDQTPSALIGVSPQNFLISEFGNTDVPTTVSRLRRAAELGTSHVIATQDLTAGSADPGPPLRPTSLVLVGDAVAEAPLLVAAPSIGLDLPMRYLVWVDDEARTMISYPDIRVLAQRHGIAPTDPAVVKIAADCARIARTAAGVTG